MSAPAGPAPGPGPDAGQSDEEIARRVQEGDVESFGVLVRRYEQKLLRYARKFLLDSADAEDQVQEAFIKAFVSIRSFDASRKFSSWLYRIAHNEFVSALRRRGSAGRPFADLDALFPHPAAKETADDRALREELRRTLDRSIARLGEKYREPVVLYYYAELSYQEIAETLHLPVSTVGVRLQRAKRLLKRFAEAEPL